MILNWMFEILTGFHLVGSWISFATAVPVLFNFGRSLYRQPKFTIELAGTLAVGVSLAGSGALLFYGKVPGWMTETGAVLMFLSIGAIFLLMDYENRVKPQREALAQQRRLREAGPQ
jgi:hypothetical protein